VPSAAPAGAGIIMGDITGGSTTTTTTSATDLTSADFASLGPSATPAPTGDGSTATTVAAAAVGSATGEPVVVKRKRGRPPKDKSATPTPPVPKGPPKKRGRPRKSKEGYEEWMTMVSENGGSEWEGSIEEYWRRHFAAKEGGVTLTSLTPTTTPTPAAKLGTSGDAPASSSSTSASASTNSLEATSTSTPAVAVADPQQGLEAAKADDASGNAAEEFVDKQQKAEAGNGVAATTTTTVDAKPEREDGEQGVVEKMEEEQGDDKDNGSAAVKAKELTTTKETKMKTMMEKKNNGQEEASEQEDDEEKDEFIFVSSHINASIVEKLKALRAALLTGTPSALSTRTRTTARARLTMSCPLICNVCSINRGRCGNPDRGQGLCLRLTAQRGHRFPHPTHVLWLPPPLIKTLKKNYISECSLSFSWLSVLVVCSSGCATTRIGSRKRNGPLPLSFVLSQSQLTSAHAARPVVGRQGKYA
jgi:hypothetical protein